MDILGPIKINLEPYMIKHCFDTHQSVTIIWIFSVLSEIEHEDAVLPLSATTHQPLLTLNTNHV